MWTCRTLPIVVLLCVSAAPALAHRDPVFIGPEFQVNETDSTSTMDVNMDADGGFVVVWQVTSSSGFQDIVMRRFDAQGAALSSEMPVNDPGTRNHEHPKIAMTPGGVYLVAWTRSPGGARGRIYSPVGVGLSDEFPLEGQSGVSRYVMRPAGDGFFEAFADLPDGDIATRTLVQRYDDAGSPMGTFQRAAVTSSNPNWLAMASNSLGAFVVAWRGHYDLVANCPTSSSTLGIFARRFDSEGAPLGTQEILVDCVHEASAGPVAAGLDDAGGFVILWTDRRASHLPFQTFGRRYDGSGSPAGQTFVVDADLPQLLPRGGFDMDMAGSGAFVSLRQSGNGLFTRRFDFSINPAGPIDPNDVVIPTDLQAAGDLEGFDGNAGSLSALAMRPDGESLVAVWPAFSFSQGHHIRGQIVSRCGCPRDAEIFCLPTNEVPCQQLRGGGSSRWSSPRGQVCNNCYNYAGNVTNNCFSMPGAEEYPYTPSPWSCDELNGRLLADGFFPSIGGSATCAAGECTVAAFVAPRLDCPGWPEPFSDYHFYRKNGDGTWSHKAGWSPVTNVDTCGETITDPETANRTFRCRDPLSTIICPNGKRLPETLTLSPGWTEFCGYYCYECEEHDGGGLPHDVFDTGGGCTTPGQIKADRCGGGAAGPAADGLQPTVWAAIGLFSGMPDPEWSFTDPDEIERIRTMLEAGAPVGDPGFALSMGYRGILLVPNEAVEDFPAGVRVFNGVIEILGSASDSYPDGAAQEHYSDPLDLEQFLVDRAVQEGFGHFLGLTDPAVRLRCTATASPSSGEFPLTVTFDAGASDGEAPYSYDWDFDDGGSSTLEDPVHTYQSPGVYTAQVTVTDSGQEPEACETGVQVDVLDCVTRTIDVTKVKEKIKPSPERDKIKIKLKGANYQPGDRLQIDNGTGYQDVPADRTKLKKSRKKFTADLKGLGLFPRDSCVTVRIRRADGCADDTEVQLCRGAGRDRDS